MIVTAEERAHARPFSPSSFARAEACPPSIDLTLEGGRAAPRPVSFATLFGTVTHEVLAACVRTRCAPTEVEAVVVAGEQIPVTDAMRGMVQAVLDYIARRFPERTWLSEVRVSSPWGKQFGYVDLISVDLPLVIVDLKTGSSRSSLGAAGSLRDVGHARAYAHDRGTRLGADRGDPVEGVGANPGATLEPCRAARAARPTPRPTRSRPPARLGRLSRRNSLCHSARTPVIARSSRRSRVILC